MTENIETDVVARLAMVTLDCTDPEAEAAFWSAVLDWKVVHSQAEYAMITGDDGHALGFGRVEDYEPTPWPNEKGSKQVHFDLAVADLPAAEARCVGLGATVPDHQPADAEGGTWRVLLDPAGHPFCLTDAANWG